LYKEQAILEQAETYACEKIHGCSSSICFTRVVSEYTNNVGEKSVGNFHYHGGGVPGATFKALFNTAEIEAKLSALPYDKITVFGESYGGSMQKNQWRYGDKLKFVAFDVRVNEDAAPENTGGWLTVPEAEKIVLHLGLEFVHYVRIPTKLSLIDEWRDACSEQAIRNGVTTRDGQFIRREGVVLRTVDEKLDRRGNRIIAKHKRDEERETKTPRKVVDPAKVEILKGARKIAEEYVVAERLNHVISHLGIEVVDMTCTKAVIGEMIKDVNREGAGEFEPSDTVNAEIGKRTAQLLKQYLADKLKENNAH
jgi:hypothetical protein